MRVSRYLLCSLLAACTVPDKSPVTDDGGIGDSPVDVPDDPTAPDTMIVQAPGEFSPTGSAMFVFESTASAATFQCSIDEETPVPCTSPYIRTLADGPHGIVVRAFNAAGNSDDTPAEHRWTIDTVAPDTTLTEKPPVADNSVMVRFDFESSELNVSYECRVDGGDFVACLPDDQFGPLGDGAHSFSVRALDRAGNADPTPVVYAWSINTAMPDTQILTAPNDISGTTSATFTFMSPDAGSGATFTCSLDGAAFTACSSPMTYQNLAERMHNFKVRVLDAVGNLDPTPATRDWLVDLTAPNTTITAGPTGMTPSASATFSFTATEPDVTFECQLDGGAFAACTSPRTILNIAQGDHTFAVRAIDAANHADATPATRAWTVDTVAPNIAITGGPAADSTSGPYVTFTFTASEGATQCSLDAAAFAACTSPVSFNAPAGAHQFQIRAVDGAGNTGMAIRSWTVACGAPAPEGAAGLLHLDDVGQTLANATGGAAATLGDDATVEVTDPTAGAGRFAGGLAFDGGDHVAWPAALGATAAFTVELWSKPSPSTGTQVLFVSGDGRLALRVTGGATTVKYSLTVVEAVGANSTTVSSADVPAGVWHHVVASLDEPTLRLWVDGTRTQIGGVALGGGPSLDAVRLGDGFIGSLDEVWLAQSALETDDEVRARYCPL
ncbi:MAG: hypothetical protein H0V17_22975 [Deltaproteobacteria bacterium]|nr:hypothetical protein [Deltaproteobacteria bacterium]